MLAPIGNSYTKSTLHICSDNVNIEGSGIGLIVECRALVVGELSSSRVRENFNHEVRLKYISANRLGFLFFNVNIASRSTAARRHTNHLSRDRTCII